MSLTLIICAVLLVVLFYIVAVYNGLVRRRQQVNEAWP